MDNLSFNINDEYMVVSIKDKMDSLNAQDIHKIVEEKIKDYEGDIIFDFEHLEYMTSAGLQVILMVSKNRKEKNKTVSIYKPQKAVDYVLNISGFYSFVEKIDKMP